jgi:hypothetical protein
MKMRGSSFEAVFAVHLLGIDEERNNNELDQCSRHCVHLTAQCGGQSQF